VLGAHCQSKLSCNDPLAGKDKHQEKGVLVFPEYVSVSSLPLILTEVKLKAFEVFQKADAVDTQKTPIARAARKNGMKNFLMDMVLVFNAKIKLLLAQFA